MISKCHLAAVGANESLGIYGKVVFRARLLTQGFSRTPWQRGQPGAAPGGPDLGSDLQGWAARAVFTWEARVSLCVDVGGAQEEGREGLGSAPRPQPWVPRLAPQPTLALGRIRGCHPRGGL